MKRYIPFLGPKVGKFTFIDLFAGIGGFRLACQALGGRCIFSSEWDEKAQKTYMYNFGEIPKGDITLPEIKNEVPGKFDLLCAGFPCQAFSVAGRRMGFEDSRGTLFFDVADIIRNTHPKAVILENVKNLKGHNNGNTFKSILLTLNNLGYFVYDKVMSPHEYVDIPQNRERIFIVCFNTEIVHDYLKFTFPAKINLTNKIDKFIDYSVSDSKYFYTEKMSHYKELCKGITSQNTIYQWRRKYVRENKNKLCPTLTANMGEGGHNVPLILTDQGIRKLTPKECLNFQGFPEKYNFPTDISMTACYKQVGNSVVVPLIQKICQQILKILI